MLNCKLQLTCVFIKIIITNDFSSINYKAETIMSYGKKFITFTLIINTFNFSLLNEFIVM